MVPVKYWRLHILGNEYMLNFFRLHTAMVILFTGSFATAEDAAEQLLTLLRPIDSLTANFEQQSLDKNGKLLQQQTGNFVIKRSGEFFWSVKPPYEQHIISDGRVINIYDPDLEQLTIKSIDQKTQMIPLLLFSNNIHEIISQYAVSQIEAGSKPVFELKPRHNGNLFDRLAITFSLGKSGSLPIQLEIIDSLRQITRIRFDKALLNRSVDPKIFLFSVPEGVDVIDERR